MELGEIQSPGHRMDTTPETEHLSQLFESETNLGGTVCGKAARTGL